MRAPPAGFDNRLSLMQTDPTDTTELTAEIGALLDSPDGGTAAPSLSELEDTLTTGYARALALQAERDRIERELAVTDRNEQELLRNRLEDVELTLSDLRRILVPLRSRARAARSLAGDWD
jgi:hypothetical protein